MQTRRERLKEAAIQAEYATGVQEDTEEQARRALVPSRTTLLGLVKHATFVERVWFDEAVTGFLGYDGRFQEAARNNTFSGGLIVRF